MTLIDLVLFFLLGDGQFNKAKMVFSNAPVVLLSIHFSHDVTLFAIHICLSSYFGVSRDLRVYKAFFAVRTHHYYGSWHEVSLGQRLSQAVHTFLPTQFLRKPLPRTHTTSCTFKRFQTSCAEILLLTFAEFSL